MINNQSGDAIDVKRYPFSKNEKKSNNPIKELPNNFFEKVIDLELKIKKEFNMEILEELTYLYSLAIEYYESIDNPRFKDYQNKLNNLLIQPDIIKKMNNPIYRNKNNFLISEDYERKRKIEQAKKDLKMKIIYKSRLKNISNNETEINNILKNYNKQRNDPQDKLEKELKQQEFNFKYRLKQKKKMKNQYNSNNHQQQIFFNSNDEEFFIGSTYNTTGNIEKELIEEGDEDKFDEKNLEKENIVNKEGEEKLNDTDNILQNNSLLQFLTQKQKTHFNEIKQSIHNFMIEYSSFYNENIFDKFKEQSKKLMDEKYKKYSEVAESYYNQIKEVEFILEAEDDQERQTPLKIIIESLKEEQEHQLDLIEDHYEKLFEKCYNQFKTQARTNSGIQLIEEKLRFEIYNQIKNIVNPKK